MAHQEERFVARYEEIYGAGSSFPGAGSEIGVFRVRARGRSGVPAPAPVAAASKTTVVGERSVYWPELGRWEAAALHDGRRLYADQRLEGPALVQFPSTLIALRPGDKGWLDAQGNLSVEVKGVSNGG